MTELRDKQAKFGCESADELEGFVQERFANIRAMTFYSFYIALWICRALGFFVDTEIHQIYISVCPLRLI